MSIPMLVSTNLNDLRKKEGQRRRRSNLAKLKNENSELRHTIQALRKEISKLRTSRPSTPPPSPTKIFFDHVSPNAKKRAILRLKDEDLPRGTPQQIRNKFGINISKNNLSSKTSQSTLKSQIEAFLCRDDITKLCPDKKKQVDGQQVRYCLNNMKILHQQFELETSIDVDYVTFTRHVPPYIQKPNHDSWGTCLCIVCLNPQLKYEKIQQLKHKYSNIKNFMNSAPTDLYDLVSDEMKIKEFKDNLAELEKEKIVVTFCEWQKKKIPDYKAPISTKVPMSLLMKEFVQKFLSEIDVSSFFY
ncbi:unnamed protein product [Rotaria sordida]|uniref:Uncharacterized protein n=1 Tax=Rotaria sordida TaxID=392033 RepID=A0A819Z2R9_9BILA|nr:unnamed protein product [Rotaria sordida]CAF4167652.1 unnamed protein product [Rotaria sordida]